MYYDPEFGSLKKMYHFIIDTGLNYLFDHYSSRLYILCMYVPFPSQDSVS